MDYLRMPTLNLHKQKYKHKHPINQIQHIQTQSINLLLRSKSKEVLSDIKLQMYLKNYKNNLNYFVSPSKYKDKAKEYLTNNTKSNEQLYLLRMKHPQSKNTCLNCFNKIKVKTEVKKCQCQYEINRAQCRGMQTSRQRYDKWLMNNNVDYHFGGQSNSNSNSSRQKQIYSFGWRQAENHKFEFVNKQKLIINRGGERQSKQQLNQNYVKMIYQQVKRKNNFQRSPNQTPTIIQQTPSLISHNSSQKTQHQNLTKRHKFQQSNNIFLNSLKSKQQQLKHYRLNLNDQSTLNIDFTDILSAKKQYIDKSNEILNKLDRIILKSQRSTFYE